VFAYGIARATTPRASSASANDGAASGASRPMACMRPSPRISSTPGRPASVSSPERSRRPPGPRGGQLLAAQDLEVRQSRRAGARVPGVRHSVGEDERRIGFERLAHPRPTKTPPSGM
jgi:hypothetical protein